MKHLLTGQWFCILLCVVPTTSAPNRNKVSSKAKIPGEENVQRDPYNAADGGSKQVHDTSMKSGNDVDWNLNSVQYLNSDLNSENGQYYNPDLNADMNSDHGQYLDPATGTQTNEPFADNHAGPVVTSEDKTGVVDSSVDKTSNTATNPDSKKIKDAILPPETGQVPDVNIGAGAVGTKPAVGIAAKGENSLNLNKGITGDGKPDISSPGSGQEAVFICIETLAPDAFKAGMIKQTETASSKHTADPNDNVGKKIDKLFHKFFQSFVYSKSGKSVDKLDPSVTTDTGYGEKNKDAKINGAMDPFLGQTPQASEVNAVVDTVSRHFGQKSKTADGSSTFEPVFVGSDTTLNGGKDTHSQQHVLSKVITGPEARRQSKKMFEQMGKFGERISNIFREFFPGLIDVKVSTGPRSMAADQQQAKLDTKVSIKSDSPRTIVNTADQTIHDINDINTNSDKQKGIRMFDKVESGIDSILKSTKPFMGGQFLSNLGRLWKPENVLNPKEQIPIGDFGHRIDGILKNMFRSFMNPKNSFSSDPFATNVDTTATDVRQDSLSQSSRQEPDPWNSISRVIPRITNMVLDSFKTNMNNFEQPHVTTDISTKKHKGKVDTIPTDLKPVPNVPLNPIKEKSPLEPGSQQTDSFVSAFDGPKHTLQDPFASGIDKSREFSWPSDSTNNPYPTIMEGFRRKFGNLFNDFQKAIMVPYLDTASKSITGSDAMGAKQPKGDSVAEPLSPAIL